MGGIKLKKRLLSLFLCVLLLLPTTLVNAEQKHFKDIDQSHWAYNAIMEMVEKGILDGFDDGTFRPNDALTREQFAKILALAMNAPQNETYTVFADVSEGDWAFPYIVAVGEYLKVYETEGRLYFYGKEPAVREDMATAIVKAKGLEGETPNLSLLDKFLDQDEISSILRGSIAIAIENKIMEGDGKYFYPQETLTRAEACALIYKSGLINSDTKTTLDPKVEDGYELYNDGLVSFQYPEEYSESYNEMGAAFSGWKQGSFLELRYKTSINNTELRSTTLNDIYNAVLTEYGSAQGKTIIVYDNAIVVVTDHSGWYYYDIYGRGIGQDIPHINLMLTADEKSDSQKKDIDKIAEKIIETFKVESSKQPISNGAVSVQMEKVFNDGNIKFSYPAGLTLSKSDVTVSGYQNYSGSFNGITVEVEYVVWRESGTYIDQIGNYLNNKYSNQNPVVYHGGWVWNVYYLLRLDDTKPRQEIIYGRGMDQIVPVITITSSKLSGQFVSGDQESTNYQTLVDKIMNSFEVISETPATPV